MHESIIKENKGLGTTLERLAHLTGMGGTNARTHWKKWSGILKKIKASSALSGKI
jgi:hypothetical protein